MCFEQYTIVRHWSCLSLLPCSAQNVQVATSTIRKVAGSHLVVQGGNSWINATIIREFPPQPQLPRKFRIWRQIWEPQNWKPKDNLDSYIYIVQETKIYWLFKSWFTKNMNEIHKRKKCEVHLWPIAWCRCCSPRQKYLEEVITLTSLKSKQYTPQTFLRSPHSSLKHSEKKQLSSQGRACQGSLKSFWQIGGTVTSSAGGVWGETSARDKTKSRWGGGWGRKALTLSLLWPYRPPTPTLLQTHQVKQV